MLRRAVALPRVWSNVNSRSSAGENKSTKKVNVEGVNHPTDERVRMSARAHSRARSRERGCASASASGGTARTHWPGSPRQPQRVRARLACSERARPCKERARARRLMGRQQGILCASTFVGVRMCLHLARIRIARADPCLRAATQSGVISVVASHQLRVDNHF
eukprot:2240142-Pleurochrysis_carterae.AAC.1